MMSPETAATQLDLGRSLQAAGDLAGAAAAFQRAIALDFAHPEAHCGLAAVLRAQGKKEEAYAIYVGAVQRHPHYAAAHIGLGDLLYDAAQLEMAIAAFRAAIRIAPENPQTHFTLANALKEQGDFGAAIAAYKDAIRLQPDFLEARRRLIYCLSFAQAVSPQELLAVSREYDRVVRNGRPASRVDVHGPDAHGRLRVGIISAEIGAHAVSYFLESYLRHYDRKKIHLTLYSTALRKEPRHAALRGLADASRDLHMLSDDAGRSLIQKDGIDVLIDTTGHMLHSRLAMLAQRCAPVQCHYIGYHGTTGVAAIDYFIGDDCITPPAFDDHFSEKIWRLPRLWVAYTPPPDLPAPRQRADTDAIALGSFNNLGKVQDQCLEVWIEVLRALPEATLMLKDAFDVDDYSKNRVAAALRHHGIGADRVVLAGRVPQWRDHMELYNTIDIALDTWPLNSGTTGFDALLMGTPLVASEGSWMGGRMSTAMVKALGIPEWSAGNAADYVDIVKRLASDKTALRNHKITLRQKVIQSDLCNGATLARTLDAAFEDMVRIRTRR